MPVAATPGAPGGSPSLLDTIQQNSASLLQQGPQQTGQTYQAQSLLGAKTGKQAGVAGGDYASSNLGEQQAVSQGQNTLQNQLAPAAMQQNTSLQQSGQAAQNQLQNQTASIAQQRSQQAQQTTNSINATLQNLAQQRGAVTTQEYTDSLEQAGMKLRLQNQQYVQQLTQAGNMARLNQSDQFQQALAQATYGDNLQVLQQSLGDQAVLSGDQDQFSEQLANLNTSAAYQMFANNMSSQQQAQLFAGFGALTTAGLGAYGSQQSGAFDSNYQDYRGAGGTQNYQGYQNASTDPSQEGFN